jgi:hypothetical protein
MNKVANSMPAYPWEIADLLVGAYLESHQRSLLRSAEAKSNPGSPRDSSRPGSDGCSSQPAL